MSRAAPSTLQRTSQHLALHQPSQNRHGGPLTLLLLFATVNGNDLETHRARVLLGKRAETTTRTDNRDRLTGPGPRLLQTLVHSNSGTEHRGNGIECTVLGNAGGVCCLGDGVLLERAIDRISREKSFRAQGLVRGLAEVTRQARAIDPLDACVVTTIDCQLTPSPRQLVCVGVCAMLLQLPIIHEASHGDHDTSTLVSTDEGKLGGKWPVTIHSVQVGVAHARVFDVDENLIGAGLLHGNLLVHHWPTGLLDDLRPLCLGNWCCHCCGVWYIRLGDDGRRGMWGVLSVTEKLNNVL